MGDGGPLFELGPRENILRAMEPGEGSLGRGGRLKQRWRWGRSPLPQPLARRNRGGAAACLASLPALWLLRVGEEASERRNGG